MAGNNAPATVTMTSTIGPGLSVAGIKFTDVQDLEFDFFHNIVKVMRQGSGSTQIYDYSNMNTVTFSIVGGVTTVVISS